MIDVSDSEMEIVPESEFSVKRVVKHTSASTYKLNHKTVTASEL